MKRIFRLFVSRGFLMFIAFLVFALLIWFGGPLVAVAEWRPLAPELTRIVVIAAVLAFWILKSLIAFARSKLRNRRLFDALQSSAPAKAPDEPPEARVVRERFDQAMDTMRNTQLSGGSRASFWSRLQGNNAFAYQLPWYMFIGAPGSGKTTALLNSGLRFPLAERLGEGPLRGVGGTRNCDWWFTDDAVMIDTAGRYTTQDSNQRSDATEWGSFVDSLRKYRPRQPLNGVLVVVSVPDLLAGERRVQEQAEAVQARIRELSERLASSFPIYVLVTKMDLLAGFSEFFDSFDRERREQVWGMTFEFDERHPPPYDPADFRAEFARLVDRLDALKPAQMQGERLLARRAAVFGFPHQLMTLGAPLDTFLRLAFAESPLSARPIVRGVFLTSGTQEGNPIDRVRGALARRFGVAPQMLAASQGAGRSYFLTHVLRRIVFAEAGIAGTNLAWVRRTNFLRWGLTSFAVIATALFIGGSVTSYLNNRDYLAAVGTASEQLREPIVKGQVPTDPKSLLVLLDAVRGVATTPQVDPEHPRAAYRFGLLQADKIAEASEQSYRDLVTQIVPPVLTERIERVLRRGGGNAQFQYETLKTYAMLTSPERLDADAVSAWVGVDLQVNGDMGLSGLEQGKWLAHVDTLLRSGRFQAAPLDANLLAQTRAVLSATPFPDRVYERLLRQGVGREFADFRIDRAVNAAELVFSRRDNLALSEGVPGLFTHDGYHKGFSKAVEQVIGDLASEETWVLGIADSPNAKQAASLTTRGRLVDQVKRRYLNEYADRWERFIGSITVVGGGGLTQTIQTLQIMSETNSPLVTLIKAMVHEVTLAGPSPDAQPSLVDKASAELKSAREKLLATVQAATDRNAARPSSDAAIENIVDARFAALRQLVTPAQPGGPVPLDDAVKLTGDVYRHLITAKQALDQNLQPPSSPIFLDADAKARRLPEPVRNIVAGLAQAGEAATGVKGRQILGQEMQSEVSDICRRAIGGRYPFDPGSAIDVAPGDFQQLFGPAGVLESFFNTRLRSQVDTSARQWRFRQAGQDAPLPSAALAQFQRAADIRRAFFGAAGTAINTAVTLSVLEMDPAILQMTLDIDGQAISYQHGPRLPTTIKWPGPAGTGVIRLEISPPPPAGQSALVLGGPWALNRFFDRAQKSAAGGAERFRASFDLGGRRIAFDVRATSVDNPFNLPALRQFRCPGTL